MSDLRSKLIERLTVRPEPFEFNGVSAYLRPWTVAERRSFLADHHSREDKDEQFAERLVIASLCDEDGRLVFSPDDLAVVSEELDGRFIEAAAARAFELSRLGGDDPKAAAPSGATRS